MVHLQAAVGVAIIVRPPEAEVAVGDLHSIQQNCGSSQRQCPVTVPCVESPDQKWVLGVGSDTADATALAAARTTAQVQPITPLGMGFVVFKTEKGLGANVELAQRAVI